MHLGLYDGQNFLIHLPRYESMADKTESTTFSFGEVEACFCKGLNSL